LANYLSQIGVQEDSYFATCLLMPQKMLGFFFLQSSLEHSFALPCRWPSRQADFEGWRVVLPFVFSVYWLVWPLGCDRLQTMHSLGQTITNLTATKQQRESLPQILYIVTFFPKDTLHIW